MIKKYLFIALTITSISLVSCSQDDETIIAPEKNKSLNTKIIPAENQNTAKSSDSIFIEIPSTYPPKNENHVTGSDSLSLSDDPNDPRKTGTHWKGKN